MLNSNQPYQRVDDGIGAGLVGGAVAGGAVAGATQMWGKQAIESGIGASQSRYSNIRSQNAVDQALPNLSPERREASQNRADKAGNRHIGVVKGGSKAIDGIDNRFSKGWRGRGATYAGSVLAGGALGAGIDALNN